MLTLGFVKVTCGYMKKAESKPCLFHITMLIRHKLLTLALNNFICNLYYFMCIQCKSMWNLYI
jgi:hypothetical protein